MVFGKKSFQKIISINLYFFRFCQKKLLSQLFGKALNLLTPKNAQVLDHVIGLDKIKQDIVEVKFVKSIQSVGYYRKLDKGDEELPTGEIAELC